MAASIADMDRVSFLLTLHQYGVENDEVMVRSIARSNDLKVTGSCGILATTNPFGFNLYNFDMLYA